MFLLFLFFFYRFHFVITTVTIPELWQWEIVAPSGPGEHIFLENVFLRSNTEQIARTNLEQIYKHWMENIPVVSLTLLSVLTAAITKNY